MNLDENKITEQGKILLVDDTPANLEFIIMFLKKENYAVAISTSGDQAIIEAEKIEPDVILLDVMMPGRDGFETCRELKKNPITQHIPVIFMSALSDAIVKVKGFDAGGVDYITKPVEIKELLVRIKAHQSVSKMEQRLVNANKLLTLAQDKLQLLQQDHDLLLSNHRLFNKALSSSSIGYWRWNILNDEITFSDEMYKMFELDKANTDEINIIPKNIHQEDFNKLVDLNKAILNKETENAIVYRLISSNGNTKSILRKCELEYDGKKIATAIFGIDQDITEILYLENKKFS